MELNSSEIEKLQIVTYVTVSFLTLLVYDWSISLTREVIRVWRSRWSVVKVLYLYTRYAPFIVMAIAAQERISSTCNRMTFTTVFAGVIIGISDRHLCYEQRPYFIIKSRRNHWKIVLFRIQGVKCGIILTLLTAWKTLDLSNEFHLGQVVSMIYCEATIVNDRMAGLFYYFMILPITIANMAVFLLAPVNFFSLGILVREIYQLVLHVREVSEHDPEDVEDEDDLLPTFIIEEAIEPYNCVVTTPVTIFAYLIGPLVTRTPILTTRITYLFTCCWSRSTTRHSRFVGVHALQDQVSILTLYVVNHRIKRDISLGRFSRSASNQVQLSVNIDNKNNKETAFTLEEKHSL
ncbi:hypothetical protein DFH05DRAFT_1464286 [Lentinula detonsa]|uniref:DUF6533 domain-containing protein n=1 Tax=Lentinula detonsa TaxID=2804962 RepID=A0A9W8NQJ6_9AGAR|nr:hypothetical protein DFH05DRAFT_1464286 [Lentinula detonsa]